MSLLPLQKNGFLSSLQFQKGNNKGNNWALVLEDGSVINFTSIMSIDVDSTNKVINAPTESAFATYNKSIGPTMISLNAAFAGSDSERQAITEKLLALSGDMSLLTLITPETVFKGYNIESVSYSRKPDDGVNIIYFDIGLVEIKEVEQQYTNVKIAKKKQTGQKNGEESALSGISSKIFGQLRGVLWCAFLYLLYLTKNLISCQLDKTALSTFISVMFICTQICMLLARSFKEGHLFAL